MLIPSITRRCKTRSMLQFLLCPLEALQILMRTFSALKKKQTDLQSAENFFSFFKLAGLFNLQEARGETSS